jgi:hypothetical protein
MVTKLSLQCWPAKVGEVLSRLQQMGCFTAIHRVDSPDGLVVNFFVEYVSEALEVSDYVALSRLVEDGHAIALYPELDVEIDEA